MARAHARISRGDLGPDAIDVIECLDAPDRLAFRAVRLPGGDLYPPGSFGDRRACSPLDRELPPGGPDEGRLPPKQVE